MRRNIFLSIIALILCTSMVKADNDKYERMVLIEEFTTEKCASCPNVMALLKEVMAKPEYAGKLIATAHHSAFYTDWLTTDADIEYKWFYNFKSTYTPGIMFDRYPFFETKGRPGTDQRKPTPVAQINTMNNFDKYIGKRLAEKAHVGFSLTGEYDNNNTITVHVSGSRDMKFTDTDARITIFLVENNIKTTEQAGVQGDYYHQHVLRTYNSTWGDVINWNNDNFEYECQLILDPTWIKDNIEIIAFVHAYDSENPGNCAIENARIINFETILGIEDINNDTDVVSTDYITLDGMHTNAISNGILIQKQILNDGSVKIKKIIR